MARHLRGNDPDFGELRLGERDCRCDCPPNAGHAGVLRPFSACWAADLVSACLSAMAARHFAG